MIVVNVFLPTMKGTKLSFMRDVLADKKLHLKQNEFIRLDIPGYQELSVKNLYEDAMKDPVLTNTSSPRCSSPTSCRSASSSSASCARCGSST